MLTVNKIYQVINDLAPFSSQESWDNSGLLVGDGDMPAKRILTALDISMEVIEEAERFGAQLIVAHHPVIFSPLKSLSRKEPVYQLAAKGIAAICVHTPLDIAPAGLNVYAHDLLKKRLSLEDVPSVLEPSWTDGRGFGWMDNSRIEWTIEALAEQLREAFDCDGVRYSRTSKKLRRMAFCSGSAASILELAVAKGCDVLITGDIKHDRWYAAEYAGLALIDCGHFQTEQFAAKILAEHIQAAVPEAVVRAFSGKAPAVCFMGGDTP